MIFVLNLKQAFNIVKCLHEIKCCFMKQGSYQWGRSEWIKSPQGKSEIWIGSVKDIWTMWLKKKSSPFNVRTVLVWTLVWKLCLSCHEKYTLSLAWLLLSLVKSASSYTRHGIVIRETNNNKWKYCTIRNEYYITMCKKEKNTTISHISFIYFNFCLFLIFEFIPCYCDVLSKIMWNYPQSFSWMTYILFLLVKTYSAL